MPIGFIQAKETEVISLPKCPDIELVRIPGGTFDMGSEEYENEQPIHEVKISTVRCAIWPMAVAYPICRYAPSIHYSSYWRRKEIPDGLRCRK